MNFLKLSVGYQHAGACVSVTLEGSASDVFLVDRHNLSKLERGGQDFTYYGGHATSSPVQLAVPSAGDWTAVVIPPPGGRVTASATIRTA
jgi:hypothetical protein